MGALRAAWGRGGSEQRWAERGLPAAALWRRGGCRRRGGGSGGGEVEDGCGDEMRAAGCCVVGDDRAGRAFG